MSGKLQFRITVTYVMFFVIMVVVKMYNSLLLFQLYPSLLSDKFDLVLWGLRLTGLAERIASSYLILLTISLLFIAGNILIPLLQLKKVVSNWLTGLLILINYTYISLLFLLGGSSYENQIAWLFLPLLFFNLSEQRRSLMFWFLRYFFIFYFFSAGLWKVFRGAVFNEEQFSAILILQHGDALVSSSEWWYAEMINWIIAHPSIGLMLYLLGTMAEVSFGAGFFTTALDRVLLMIYIVFLVADVFLMRINYYETIPFALLLLYTKPMKIFNDGVYKNTRSISTKPISSLGSSTF